MQNICLDTNTIISYLFFSEPQHSIITVFINGNPSFNYFFTEHVLEESENIFYQKLFLIRNILIDFTDFLKDDNHQTVSKNHTLNKFVQQSSLYKFKGVTVKKEVVKNVIKKYWEYLLPDVNDTFIVYIKFDAFTTTLNDVIYENREELYNKLSLIPKHTKEHNHIREKLIENNSHDSDNNIILDLYEYCKFNQKEFIFVTFDNDFYIALKRCDFEFITKVCNIDELKT